MIDYLTFRRPESVAPGICACGCGLATRLAAQTHTKDGHVQGQPMRFLRGHAYRLPRYVSDPTPSGCLEWLGSSWSGYGRVRWRGVMKPAHRVIYEQYKGPIPAGLLLDHLCRNRICVNPDHLEPVTNTENCQRGAKAKLTVEDVIEIRRLLATRRHTQRAIGERFNVGKDTVSLIHTGKIWVDAVSESPESQ